MKVLHKIILRLALVLVFTMSQNLLAQNDSLYQIILKGLNYLSSHQVKKSDSASFTGEWPSYIYNTQHIPFLGKKGKTAYDSNVFNTLFIHNILAELYFSLNEEKRIVPILQLARKNFLYYNNNVSFNFWPYLPRADRFKCKHLNCKQHRPVNFKYKHGFINNYANIFDDADDSSSGYLAYFYSNLIEPNKNNMDFEVVGFNKKLQEYRDAGKRKSNWYNKRTGFNYRTGAYLTWFGPERKHSGFISWFFPYHSKQNILYGRNEIDCVVNANILRALFITGDTLIDGVAEAKLFLRSAIQKNKCFTCGVYYPTEFSFHYALAKAISAGVTGFSDLKETMATEIINKKSINGYWVSDLEGNDLQATLYATNALIFLKGKEALPHINGIIDYLLAYMIVGENEVHWPGGIFFSGGSAIRYSHVWKSDAYTTSLALETLVNYSKLKNRL